MSILLNLAIHVNQFMDWKTFGHNQAKKILDLQLKSEKFSQTYLFLGPEATGKKMLALEFAKQILKTDKLENHPDFLILDEPDIGIERLRQFMESLSYKPFAGKYKVALINNSQYLNPQSQNALLKTLEEPSVSTILILVGSRPPLPTIISRCQVLRFNRFSEEQMKSYCNLLGIEPLPEILYSAFGLPGKIAVQSSEDLASWKAIKSAGRADRLSKLPNFAEKEAEDLSRLFESFARAEILGLSINPQNFKAVNLLLEAAENLKKNFNKKLVIQTLFLQM